MHTFRLQTGKVVYDRTASSRKVHWKDHYRVPEELYIVSIGVVEGEHPILDQKGGSCLEFDYRIDWEGGSRRGYSLHD